MSDEAFSLDGPTAHKQALMDKHMVNKNTIAASALPIEFSRVLGDLIPSEPTQDDASMVLGAIIDFATSMIATTARVLGIQPEGIPLVTKAVIDYVSAELPKAIETLNGIDTSYLDAIAGLDIDDPETAKVVRELVDHFHKTHGAPVNG